MLLPVFVVGAAGLDGDVGERAVVVVAVEDTRGRVAGNVNIGPAVVIEVRRHRSKRVMARRLQDAGLLRHVGKRAVAVVVIQDVGRGGQAARPAIHRHALPVAVFSLARGRRVGKAKIHVVGHEEVEPPVFIVVEEAAARVPPGTRAALDEAGLFRDVGERAVAVVVIERVLAPVGHKEVVETVVIVVPDANSLAPTRARETRLPGDVGKRAVAVVVIQMVGGLLPLWEALERRAVHLEDVEPAVVVVVEKSDAAAGGLDDPVLDVLPAKHAARTQTCPRANIDERHAEGRARGDGRAERVPVISSRSSRAGGSKKRSKNASGAESQAVAG